MVERVFWGAEGCNAGSIVSGKAIYWGGRRAKMLYRLTGQGYFVLLAALAPFRIEGRRIGDKFVTGE